MNNERYIDQISTNDECRENPLYHKSLFKTDITLVNFDGDVVTRVRKHDANMTILSGRISVLEKAFGIVPNPSQRLHLNNLIPTPRLASDQTAQTYETITHSESIYTGGILNPHKFDSFVNYFCIGNKGENPNTPYVILDIHDWEMMLYGMVPFRFVPVENDLTAEERSQYRLRKRVELDGVFYYAYYAKYFNPGPVHSLKSDADYSPLIEDSLPYIGDGLGHSMKGHNSQVFIEFELEVAVNEFKEYYRATHNNSLSAARLTELGLISGYDAPNSLDAGRMELADSTLFAKLVHDPVFMSSEGSRRKVGYKVFS